MIVFLSMFHLLLLKVDVSGEADQSQAAFAGVLVAGHVLMILAIVVEAVAISFAPRGDRVAAEEGQEEEVSESSSPALDDAPVSKGAPAPCRSFPHQRRGSLL